MSLHDQRLHGLFMRAWECDTKIGSGDVRDLCMTLARIVWREAVRHERKKDATVSGKEKEERKMKKGDHACIAVDNGKSSLRIRRLKNESNDDDKDMYVVIFYPKTTLSELETAITECAVSSLVQFSFGFEGRHVAAAIADSLRKR